MKFTPNVTVSYNGVIHKAHIEFEIEPKDAEKMAQYGIVEMPPPAEKPEGTAEPNIVVQSRNKGGRPKKTN